MCPTPALYGTLRGVATSIAINPSDIDDLTQEAAIGLWHAGHTVWDDLAHTIARRRMADGGPSGYRRVSYDGIGNLGVDPALLAGWRHAAGRGSTKARSRRLMRRWR